MRLKRGAAGDPLRVGLVARATGPLAFFGGPHAFVLNRLEAVLSEGAGGHPVEIVVKDGQSNSNRAAEVASQLILQDEGMLLLSAGGPDAVLPVDVPPLEAIRHGQGKQARYRL